jgi:hypothetical protein
VSHLGDNLSALVDGELSGADLDRANAHLASCDRCRGEAATLRLLKREMRALVADASDEDALTRRLLAMAAFARDQLARDQLAGDQLSGDQLSGDQPGPGEGDRLDGELAELAGPEPFDMTRLLRPRPAFRTYHEVWDHRPLRAGRHRYLMWGAVSLAVVGGIGAAAFSMGGGTSGSGPGPGVVPQVELFNMEHAIDSGDVPFPATSPTQPTARVTPSGIPLAP